MTYEELKDSLKNIKYDEIQDVIDEASKKIRTQKEGCISGPLFVLR